MNTKIIATIVCSALLTCSRLVANTGHNDVLFEKVETSYRLFDKTAGYSFNLSRMAENPGPRGNVKAKPFWVIRISGLQGRDAFSLSLLTLGIQHVDWTTKVRISSISPRWATAEILDNNHVSKGKQVDVPPTGKAANSTEGRDMPVESAVWMLKLENVESVEIEVQSANKPDVGYTLWRDGPPRGGHDNIPPD